MKRPLRAPRRRGAPPGLDARLGWRCLLTLALSLTCGWADDERHPREKFAFQRHDVVVFTGGAHVVAAQENACLETILTRGLPTLGIRFRNMGWEGDTVYQQRRDLNFGSWAQQFKRVDATVIVVQFGQMESLDGSESLPSFVAAYEKLLDEFAKQTPRIVLVSPFPFESTASPLPDLTRHNEDVRQFAGAIRMIAQRRNCHFVDLFTPFAKPARTDQRQTGDGLSLNPYGHWLIARETAKQLGIAQAGSGLSFDVATGAIAPGSAEHLRQTILIGNRYWFDYWRPMNWAFLHGDRTEQPSSRDHRDQKIRWFPEELERFMPLIEATEREIAVQANQPD